MLQTFLGNWILLFEDGKLIRMIYSIADPILLYSFEKRIYIPLPDAHARATMFQLNVGTTPCTLTAADYKLLADRTDG